MGFDAGRRFPRNPRRRSSGRRLQSPGGSELSGAGEVYFTGFMPFISSFSVFTLGSALCGAAPSLGALIVARCLQGVGAAAIFSVNVAMITRSFPAAERGRALGINMILLALGVSVGPTVGGILTQALSWRWIFYVNLPIGAMVMLAAWRLLTERHHLERQHLEL